MGVFAHLASRAFLAGAADRAVKSFCGSTGAALVVSVSFGHYHPLALILAPVVFVGLSMTGSVVSSFIGDRGTTSAIPGGH